MPWGNNYNNRKVGFVSYASGVVQKFEGIRKRIRMGCAWNASTESWTIISGRCNLAEISLPVTADGPGGPRLGPPSGGWTIRPLSLNATHAYWITHLRSLTSREGGPESFIIFHLTFFIFAARRAHIVSKTSHVNNFKDISHLVNGQMKNVKW